MSTSRNRPRKAVSFTKFRQIHLTAFKDLRSLYVAPECTASIDAKLTCFALEWALQDGRFGDAVHLARTLGTQTYSDARSYRLGAQLVAFVKKVPFIDPSLNPEANALSAYRMAEEMCAQTNARLRPYYRRVNGAPSKDAENLDEQLVKVILRARRHILRVLGSRPPLSKIYPLCRFGKGSANRVHGDATHYLKKLSAETWTVSSAAEPYARAAAMTDPNMWRALGLRPEEAIPLYRDAMCYYRCNSPFRGISVEQARLKFSHAWTNRIERVEHDLITYVPKDADKHRTVGTQPLLNTYIQLGTGDYLVERLRTRAGIDIRTAQGEVNGKLALLGSHCDGADIATIDLKAASDTVSIGACRVLLPAEWFDFLNCIRTPTYMLPETEVTVRYEKMCAMGNGFCFPLETLVFWGLCQAVYDECVIPDRLMAVYGDDIIVYQSAALRVIEVLEQLGFATNTDKTFVFGPFRESCGQDYFNGIYVRPVVVDEVFENWGQVFHFVNSLQRRGYTSLAATLRDLIPEKWRFVRPYPGVTSTALEVDWDTFMASSHARFRAAPPPDPEKPFFGGWSWAEFLSVPVHDTDEYDVQNHLACALNGAAVGHDGRPLGTFRRKTSTYVRRVAHG